MKYTIIEDCSPYYIRFTHDGLLDIIDYCKSNIPLIDDERTFIHHKLNDDQATHLLSVIPLSKELFLQKNRVSFFITKPGRYYRAHKDGLDARISINYTVQILDDKCVTSWYSDEDLKNYPIDNLSSNTSRECAGFIKENHTPLKSMTAKPNECILFNTDIFHDFDNSQSSSTRVILTLRIDETIRKKMYFDDVKNILFMGK
jgi:hypothetical protein